MTLWSTPKKILVLLSAVGLIASLLLFVVKPMLSGDNETVEQTTTETTTPGTEGELLKPSGEVALSDVPLDQVSADQALYFSYLSKSSKPIGELFTLSTELPKLSAERAKDLTDKTLNKQSDKYANDLIALADELLAIKPEAGMEKVHEIIAAEATIIKAAANSLLASLEDYEAYEKALQDFGKALEKISLIQGDLLARVETPANPSANPSSDTSNKPATNPSEGAATTQAPAAKN